MMHLKCGWSALSRRFEWTETDVVFEPDRTRTVLFDPTSEGWLVAMQASLVKLSRAICWLRGPGARVRVGRKCAGAADLCRAAQFAAHPTEPPLRSPPASLQCGHPLLKLHASAEQVARGEALWDAVQIVPLDYVQVSARAGSLGFVRMYLLLRVAHGMLQIVMHALFCLCSSPGAGTPGRGPAGMCQPQAGAHSARHAHRF